MSRIFKLKDSKIMPKNILFEEGLLTLDLLVFKKIDAKIEQNTVREISLISEISMTEKQKGDADFLQL